MNITANYSNYAYRANQANSRPIPSPNNQNISFSGYRNKEIDKGVAKAELLCLAGILTMLTIAFGLIEIKSQHDEKVTSGIKQGNSMALPLSQRTAKIMEEGCLKDADSFLQTGKNKAGEIISSCIKKK